MVDLGPFEHKVDDGLPLRKTTFQVLNALLDRYTSELDHRVFVEHVKQGLVDANDIQILTYQVKTRHPSACVRAVRVCVSVYACVFNCVS